MGKNLHYVNSAKSSSKSEITLLLLWYFKCFIQGIFRWWKDRKICLWFFVIINIFLIQFRRAEWKEMRVKKVPKVPRLMKILRLRKAMVPPRPPRPRQLSRKSLMASKDSKENLGNWRILTQYWIQSAEGQIFDNLNERETGRVLWDNHYMLWGIWKCTKWSNLENKKSVPAKKV